MDDPLRQRSFRVLFVCTGNVCRSPTAAALLTLRIKASGAERALSAASAGVGTKEGWHMDPTIVEILAKRGVTGMAAFRSRGLSEAIVAGADLLLTGTREHRLRIGKNWPDAYPRTFTLKEAAYLLSGMPSEFRDGLPGDVGTRAKAIVSWLHDERGLVDTGEADLDINDPIGRRAGVYRRMVDDVEAAVVVIAGVLLLDTSADSSSTRP